MKYLNSIEANKIFIEKTPQHIQYLSFLRAHFPRAKFVQIVRDGRDCYCSAKHHPNIPQNKNANIFSRYYKKCLTQAIANEGSPNFYTLKYETLVKAPSEEISKLMDYLNLDFQDAQLDTSFRAKDRRSNREQFKRLSQNINSSSVGRYKSDMSQDEIQTFNRISKDVLKYYGYHGPEGD